MNIPEALVQRYLEQCDADLDELSRLDHAHALGQVRKTAHRIKGTSGTYGLRQISDLGKRLEDTAASGDEGAIAGLIRQLKDAVGRRRRSPPAD